MRAHCARCVAHNCKPQIFARAKHRDIRVSAPLFDIARSDSSSVAGSGVRVAACKSVIAALGGSQAVTPGFFPRQVLPSNHVALIGGGRLFRRLSPTRTNIGIRTTAFCGVSWRNGVETQGTAFGHSSPIPLGAPVASTRRPSCSDTVLHHSSHGRRQHGQLPSFSSSHLFRLPSRHTRLYRTGPLKRWANSLFRVARSLQHRAATEAFHFISSQIGGRRRRRPDSFPEAADTVSF
jgi:hypothetical protein